MVALTIYVILVSAFVILLFAAWNRAARTSHISHKHDWIVKYNLVLLCILTGVDLSSTPLAGIFISPIFLVFDELAVVFTYAITASAFAYIDVLWYYPIVTRRIHAWQIRLVYANVSLLLFVLALINLLYEFSGYLVLPSDSNESLALRIFFLACIVLRLKVYPVVLQVFIHKMMWPERLVVARETKTAAVFWKNAALSVSEPVATQLHVMLLDEEESRELP
eukprot:ANDGO_04605.mRNA.1 hypothetical protein